MNRQALFACTILFFVSWTVHAQTSIAVSNKRYVLPASELGTTQTYPDILTITNGFLHVQILPNRGRILSELGVQGSEQSVLYHSFSPAARVVRSGMDTFEFGGYYLSIPWNSRARQPYNLDYRIVDNNADRAKVVLSGKDILTRAIGTAAVTVRRDSPSVDIRVTIKNDAATLVLHEPDFRDFAVLSALENVGSRLLLPTNSVTILRSAGDWVGPVGAKVTWGPRLDQWSQVKGYYDVKATIGDELPGYAIVYPSLELALVKLWSPASFFDAVEVTTYGPSYAKIAGTGPYFTVSCIKKDMDLDPQRQTQFRTAFVLLKNVAGNLSLAQLYRMALALVPGD